MGCGFCFEGNYSRELFEEEELLILEGFWSSERGRRPAGDGGEIPQGRRRLVWGKREP
jgi:hypothetical protein